MHTPENTPSASLKWLGRWNVVALTTRWLRAKATVGPIVTCNVEGSPACCQHHLRRQRREITYPAALHRRLPVEYAWGLLDCCDIPTTIFREGALAQAASTLFDIEQRLLSGAALP